MVGTRLEIGRVAVIELQNPPVNALHPDGEPGVLECNESGLAVSNATQQHRWLRAVQC